MMMPKEVIDHVTAEPFRPFRIHMASGRTFESVTRKSSKSANRP